MYTVLLGFFKSTYFSITCTRIITFMRYVISKLIKDSAQVCVKNFGSRKSHDTFSNFCVSLPLCFQFTKNRLDAVFRPTLILVIHPYLQSSTSLPICQACAPLHDDSCNGARLPPSDRGSRYVTECVSPLLGCRGGGTQKYNGLVASPKSVGRWDPYTPSVQESGRKSGKNAMPPPFGLGVHARSFNDLSLRPFPSVVVRPAEEEKADWVHIPAHCILFRPVQCNWVVEWHRGSQEEAACIMPCDQPCLPIRGIRYIGG